ncbi:GntR family transcriptional regulator [Streptomyces sp. NPDC090080]|uniref:GntR family transcriptional regulator n=1 Tax=Streptomyces sp. NPDC090080 TaxID=3365939 RepID=UPI0037FD1D9C
MSAREHIQRRPTMAAQVAEKVAADIKRGRYQVGEIVPSEAQMEQMYGVGKATIRTAMAELKHMGLIETRQGKGSIVISTGGAVPPVTISRAIQRNGKGSWFLPEMTEAEAPAITRTSLDGPPAVHLDQQDQDAISVDRMVYDPNTGTRMAHRTLIPLATAAVAPSLAEAPEAPTSEIYDQLTQAGFTLSFTEFVTARAPFPDERMALGLDDAAPLLIAYRVTADAEHDRPLLCEEVRAPAATCQLAFSLAPTRTPAKRSTRRRSESA